MESFLSVLAMVYNLFNYPLNVYGFEFSFWDVAMFALITGVVLKFIGMVFYED